MKLQRSTSSIVPVSLIYETSNLFGHRHEARHERNRVQRLMLNQEFSLPRNFTGILQTSFGESRRNDANCLKLKAESGPLVRRISPILNYPGPRFSADTNNRKINVCINIARELLTRRTLERTTRVYRPRLILLARRR